MRSWGSLTFRITQNSGPPLLPICTFSKKLGARCAGLLADDGRKIWFFSQTSGQEIGKFLALDLGGTNFRVLLLGECKPAINATFTYRDTFQSIKYLAISQSHPVGSSSSSSKHKTCKSSEEATSLQWSRRSLPLTASWWWGPLVFWWWGALVLITAAHRLGPAWPCLTTSRPACTLSWRGTSWREWTCLSDSPSPSL